MKRILFIGDLNSYARSLQRCRAMKELGHKVIALSLVPVGYRLGISKKPSLWIRFCSKVGYPIDVVNINQKLIDTIKREKPDLVWIDKGLMIRPSTLRQAKNTKARPTLIFCSEDNMCKKHNQSAYFLRCLPLYDAVFTTKSSNVDELPRIGARRVVFVDQAFCKVSHRPVDVTDQDRERLGAEVGFIGTFEEFRAQQMLFLAQNDIQVRIWGYGWDAWQGRHPNLRVEGQPLYEDDYVRSICATKITLCFLRKINQDMQTSRSVEIPACGGFMLAERTAEHQRLFEEGKEAQFFGSKEELLEKVRYYLSCEEERVAIARAGRERCLKSGYSHNDRLKYMLGCIFG